MLCPMDAQEDALVMPNPELKPLFAYIQINRSWIIVWNKNYELISVHLL